MTAPVALFVFNRPDQTRRVFECLREQRPTRVLVVADGPRPAVPTDEDRCQQVRETVTRVDWPCDVSYRFADDNLGCDVRIPTGIDWVFSQVDEAILLEDDCLPQQSFFDYATELLSRYRDDPRVGMVAGYRRGTRSSESPTGSASYGFSRYTEIWGWATWADRWSQFDASLSAWQDLRATDWLINALGDGAAAAFWHHTFDRIARDEAPWDVCWQFACLSRGWLSAEPAVNLVANIGFGLDATHTTERLGDEEPVQELPLPLKHPTKVAADRARDDQLEDENFSGSVRRELRHLIRTARSQR